MDKGENDEGIVFILFHGIHTLGEFRFDVSSMKMEFRVFFSE